MPAGLITDGRGYAAEPHHGQDHVARWNCCPLELLPAGTVARWNCVLLAFGEQVPGFTGTPMTAAHGWRKSKERLL